MKNLNKSMRVLVFLLLFTIIGNGIFRLILGSIINSSNLKELLLSGTKRIAVAGAIMNANDPSSASLQLLEELSLLVFSSLPNDVAVEFIIINFPTMNSNSSIII